MFGLLSWVSAAAFAAEGGIDLDRYKPPSAHLEAAASPEALIGAALPPLPALPAQPVPLRLRVQDITSQKLVRYAADRPAGFLCYLDEMNSWIRKVCDPRSGEDRSAWVRSYEAKEYAMDRVGAGAIYADRKSTRLNSSHT